MPGAVPSAQAQTTVWEATVAAGEGTGGTGYGYIATAHPATSDFGSISDDSFDLDGTTYTVWRVSTATEASQGAYFAVATGATPAQLPSTLLRELSLEFTSNPDSQTLPLSDAPYRSDINAYLLTALQITDDINDGDIITAELIRNPNRAPTVARPIADQTATAGTAFTITFPDDAFAEGTATR